MANPHNPTVEKAIDAVFAFAPTPSHSDDYLRFCAAIDTLIAAVRAEATAPPTIDDELAKLKTVMGALRQSGIVR